jgi:hypothetical protein
MLLPYYDMQSGFALRVCSKIEVPFSFLVIVFHSLASYQIEVSEPFKRELKADSSRRSAVRARKMAS